MSLDNELGILDKIAGLRILVVGDVMLDHYVWGDATRISPEAPVPVVHVFRDSYTAGGAANVALNLRGLGATTELAGCVGDDESGHRLQGILQQEGVTFEEAWMSPSLPTIVKTRVVVQKQQLCRIDREEKPGMYAEAAAKRLAMLIEAVGQADAVILSDYAKGMLNAELWDALLDAAHDKGCLLALDPKPRRRLAFSGPGLLTPNRSEALELAGLEVDVHDVFPAEEVCRVIWDRHKPRNLVITLGAEGMLLSRKGRVEKTIPTVAQEVFDVSGAGDTVIATLTAALAAGAELETAAHLANAAAGVVVGKVGTVAISLTELESALKG